MATKHGPATRRAPQHLRPDTRRWWAAVAADWRLEEHHVRLLTLAGEAWDLCEQARLMIAEKGLTTTTRDGGEKLHPAVRVESDSRLAFARLIRELDLDLAPPGEASTRPPALRSMRGGSGAA